MAWGDFLNSMGGSQGLLMIGGNLLSSQKGQEGQALSQGLMQGQQLAAQKERQNYMKKQAAMQEQRLQAEQAAVARKQKQDDMWSQFVTPQARDMSASGVAGIGATPEQSVFDPSALNAAQQIGGGQTTPQPNENIPPEMQQLLQVLPPEEGRKVFQEFLNSQRRFGQDMTLEQYRQGQQNQRQQTGLEGQYGLAGYQAQLQRQNAEARAAASAANRQPSAQQQKYQMLINGGMDPQQAALVAGGGYEVSRDPMTGEAQLLNLADPATWAARQEDGPTIDITQGASDYSAGDVSSAVGTGGVLKNWANTAAEVVGADLPFEDNADAARTLAGSQNNFRTLMASSVGGRPSNYTQQQLDPLMVHPNEFTTGSQRALSGLKQQQEMLRDKRRQAQSVVQGRYPKNDKADAQRMLLELDSQLRVNESMINSWGSDTRPSYSAGATGQDQGALPGPEGDAGPPPEGIDAETWQYMDPEDRKLWQ